jgi:hypothetical protein
VHPEHLEILADLPILDYRYFPLHLVLLEYPVVRLILEHLVILLFQYLLELLAVPMHLYHQTNP